MDVLVERFQRRRIVSDKSSPMLYYLRQKPKTCGTVDIDVLAASIQKNCAMTKGDVKHVIEALVEEIQANLANGDKVKLNQLGTLHMTFRCPGVEKSEDCTVRNISKVNIRFVPDKELKLVNGSTAATRSTSLRTAVLPVVAAVIAAKRRIRSDSRFPADFRISFHPVFLFYAEQHSGTPLS